MLFSTFPFRIHAADEGCAIDPDSEENDDVQNALTDSELNALRQIDTPTIANAIEPFKVRSDTDGFMGWDIRCLFPDSASWSATR